MDAITSFTGRYAFLSNFYIEPDGSCVEVEYQQQKCADWLDYRRFEGLTPKQAKHLGRQVTLRHDWEFSKLSIMKHLVCKKFYDHRDLDYKLSDTGDAQLIEENWWGDTFWGTHNGIGLNHLGRILMHWRDIPF